MKTWAALVRRNMKLFFRDKGMFFTSLITPLILLVLYATFLAKVYKQAFAGSLPADTPNALKNALVGGQMLSSLLATICITVAFCSNMLMVADKSNGARDDMMITPVKGYTVALAYYVASAAVTLLICLTATAACFVYIACVGWYMRATDVLLVLTDVVLLVLFGTGLSTIVNRFLSSQGQMTAVGTIVSSAYGFICGAYMPISQMSKGFGTVFSLLPGTYGTSLLRNHALAGVIAEMRRMGYPAEAIGEIRKATDCIIDFFGHTVSVGAMYAIVVGAVAVTIGVCVLLFMFSGAKGKKHLPHKRPIRA